MNRFCYFWRLLQRPSLVQLGEKTSALWEDFMGKTWIIILAGAAFILTPLVSAAPPPAAPESWQGDPTPLTQEDWSYDRAAHLLERLGFGGTPTQINKLANMSPQEAVDRLINYQTINNSIVPPFDESGIFDPGMEPFPRSRAEAVQLAREMGEAMGVSVKPTGDRPYQHVVNKYFYYLRSNRLESHRLGQYWAQRILITERPFEEKIALFWHGHFATSDAKVRDYRKMSLQIELFRENGVGNFHDLVLAVAQDPAMLVFLDAGENIKGQPNENFAREILELFTLGIGNYSEDDIREAARAFTGWSNDSLQFVVNEEFHDEENKTFLGETGNFDGSDIIDIVMRQESTARFIIEKLYRYFVATEFPPQRINELALLLRDSGYELKPLFRAMFLARDFYAPHAYSTQIKSPVDLVLSTYRKLGVRSLPGVPDFHEATSSLGQQLLYPPNVAGWEGGRTWITPATLVERGNFAREVLFPSLSEFVSPDRALTQIYRDVGEKLSVGRDITSATVAGSSDENNMNMMSSSDMMVAVSDEEFNTRYAGYHGTLQAMRRVKPIPRLPAEINFVDMIVGEDLGTTTDVVRYFQKRLLRIPLSREHEAGLISFLDHELGTSNIAISVSYLDEPLRMLVHLIMSTPEYQLS